MGPYRASRGTPPPGFASRSISLSCTHASSPLPSLRWRNLRRLAGVLSGISLHFCIRPTWGLILILPHETCSGSPSVVWDQQLQNCPGTYAKCRFSGSTSDPANKHLWGWSSASFFLTIPASDSDQYGFENQGSRPKHITTVEVLSCLPAGSMVALINVTQPMVDRHLRNVDIPKELNFIARVHSSSFHKCGNSREVITLLDCSTFLQTRSLEKQL